MDGVAVGSHAYLRNVIVDDNVTIEDDVIVEGKGVSGPVPVLAAGSVLKRGTRLLI